MKPSPSLTMNTSVEKEPVKQLSEAEKKREEIKEEFPSLVYIDWVINILVSVGCGVVMGIACSTLSVFSGLGLPFFLVIGVAGFIANLRVYRDNFIDTVITIKGLFDPKKSEKISPLMKAGCVVVISASLAVSAITMLSFTTTLHYLFIVLGIACPPLGIYLIAGVFAFLTFFAFGGMMFRSMHRFIKDTHEVGHFFKDLFSLPAEKGIGNTEKNIRRVIRVILFFICIALVVFGTVMTLGAWSNALTRIFELISKADRLLCYVFGLLIGVVLTGMGRFPMVLERTGQVFFRVAEWAAWAICEFCKKIYEFCMNPGEQLRLGWENLCQFCGTIRDLGWSGILWAIGLGTYEVILLLNVTGNGAVSGKGVHDVINRLYEAAKTTHPHSVAQGVEAQPILAPTPPAFEMLPVGAQKALEWSAIIGGGEVSIGFMKFNPKSTVKVEESQREGGDEELRSPKLTHNKKVNPFWNNRKKRAHHFNFTDLSGTSTPVRPPRIPVIERLDTTRRPV